MEEWFQRELVQCSSKFTEKISTQIQVFTSNVLQQTIPVDLVAQLKKQAKLFDESDILVFNLQEVERTLKGNDTTVFNEWTMGLQLQLPEYKLVSSEKEQGTSTILFSKIELLNVQSVQKQLSIGCKAAICISFNLGQQSVLLINSHLMHDKEKVEKRNEQFHDLTGLSKFSQEACSKTRLNIKKEINYTDFDIVIWAGDLNYRMDYKYNQEELISKKIDFDRLKQFEQLYVSLNSGQAFVGFVELPINFIPTYRFLVGKDEFDLERSPSWCDRVLYKAKDDIVFEGLFYDCCRQLTYSDHRPVLALFRLIYNSIIDEKLSDIKHQLCAQYFEKNQPLYIANSQIEITNVVPTLTVEHLSIITVSQKIDYKEVKIQMDPKYQQIIKLFTSNKNKTEIRLHCIVTLSVDKYDFLNQNPCTAVILQVIYDKDIKLEIPLKIYLKPTPGPFGLTLDQMKFLKINMFQIFADQFGKQATIFKDPSLWDQITVGTDHDFVPDIFFEIQNSLVDLFKRATPRIAQQMIFVNEKPFREFQFLLDLIYYSASILIKQDDYDEMITNSGDEVETITAHLNKVSNLSILKFVLKMIYILPSNLETLDDCKFDYFCSKLFAQVQNRDKDREVQVLKLLFAYQ